MNKKINNIFYIIIIFIIIIIIFVILNNAFNNIKENMSNNQVIPLDIYQTWETKDLPPKMKECNERFKKMNPRFTCHLYDENDRLEFIKNNFDKDVLEAYETLIPGAYKADLWRYCILYKKGGIYLDIKFCNIDNFDFIEMTDKEYFARDIDQSGGGILNGILICKAGNEKLNKCIQKIVENVKNRYYGNSPLDITGPMLMKQFFTKDEIDKLEITISEYNGITTIYWKDRPILPLYPEYKSEKNKFGSNYRKLYEEKKVYKD